jgi:hypothetical protein
MDDLSPAVMVAGLDYGLPPYEFKVIVGRFS